MNLRHLEVFRAIMRHGSMTAAAEALHVSQPAVSKVLRHFEGQIGYRLFERVGGRLVPTAEAQLLFRDADRIFREVEVLKGFSDRIRDKQVGLLRVAASAPPTFALLPRAVERFRRRNPGMRFVVHTLPAEEIGERILIGDVDVGLTMAPIAGPQLSSAVVGTTEIVAVMRRGHPLAGLSALTPRDLVGETMVVLILIFAVHLGWFPAVSYLSGTEGFLRTLQALTLPILTLITHVSAQMIRMTRAGVLNVLSSPYIEMAILKGVPRRRIILRHALLNAIGPIVNVVALNLAYLVSGVIIVETIFAYPGLAKLMVDGVQNRDMPVVQACAIIFCGTYIGLILIADIASILSNPRLRFPK